MSVLPISIARVSNLLQSTVATQSINDTQIQLAEVQQELSTGKRVNTPSDDPGAATLIMSLQKVLERREAYTSNISSANGQLGEVDSTLSDLTGLIQQAQTIASANVGSDVTSDQRQAAAEVVKSIFAQTLTLGNRSFNGSFLFGGDLQTSQPFQTNKNGSIVFTGSTTLLQNTFDDSTTLAFQVNGAKVFGALSTRVTGATNVSPALTLQTLVSDLKGAGANGVRLGQITLSDGTVTKTVDLSGSNSVGDIINKINAAGVGTITANISGTGIQLNGGAAADITVNEVGSGSTAGDLGIITTTSNGTGLPVSGASVGAPITLLTPLSALRGGAGMDNTGLTITNGSITKTLPFTGCTTVQDMLNVINGSGIGVRARINKMGTGINILNATQGSAMSISEAGGTTAADLGVRSMSTSTALSDLNGGQGVRAASGNDFQITRSNGTTFPVDLSNAVTVQDVIDAINTADAGGGVTASFASNGNGIVLTDSAGGSGTMSVNPLNDSQAAQDLGLLNPPVGNTITGSDVNPVKANGVFGDLNDLLSALQTSDQAGITAAAAALKNDQDNLTVIRGSVGAQVQQLTNRQTRIDDQNVTTKSLLSNLQDTDFTAAITKFQQLQTTLQASLQTTAKSLNLSLLDFLG